MISCFETVTQHISGQPFCNMSMEALEMMVKHTKNLLFCRPAKSGEDVYSLNSFAVRVPYNFSAVCVRPAPKSVARARGPDLVDPSSWTRA